MRILLIYPGGQGTLPFGVPLGIASIAAVLRASGRDVSIADFRFEDERHVLKAIERNRPDFIGFYSTTDLTTRVLDLGKKAREASGKSFLIAGGPHATIDAGCFLNGPFDVAVIGEGEATVQELADTLEAGGSLKGVRGIAWRSPEGIVVNGPRPFIEDLDSLPLPAYDLFPNVAQTMHSNLFWSNLIPFTHVLVSRGCPYSCSFCQPTLVRMFGRKVRRMSPGRVIELLSWLKQTFGVKEVFFEDDLFLSSAFRPWLYELTDMMREKSLDIRWWAQARADSADRELLLRAKEAGCYMVMCGVESGSQKILDFYNKGTTPDDVRNLFSLCRELGLLAIAEIIFGAPLESRDDSMETIRLMKEIEPDGVSPTLLTPYPGTGVYDWLTEHGVRFETETDLVDRTLHQKRVDSPVPEDYLKKLVYSSILTTPSLKLIFKRRHYRKAFFCKLLNLLAMRQFGKALSLLLMSLPKPFILFMTYLYFSLRKRLPFVVKLKDMVKH